MTSGFVIAIECEGFLPLDPRDPENLDRKHDDRDPKAVEKRRKEWRSDAEEQRGLLLDTLKVLAKGVGHVKFEDALVRDDGTAILYFDFDPGPEGDYQVERKLVRQERTGKRVWVEKPDVDAKGEGAKTWDAALRNDVEQARSSVVGAGLQVVECRIELLPEGKKGKATKTKESKVTDPQSPSTHQESFGSDETPEGAKRYEGQTHEQLRDEAARRSLTVSGSKSDLVKRLAEDDQRSR